MLSKRPYTLKETWRLSSVSVFYFEEVFAHYDTFNKSLLIVNDNDIRETLINVVLTTFY